MQSPIYKGWDVHSYTQDCRRILAHRFTEPVTVPEHTQLIHELLYTYRLPKYQEVSVAIKKMARRYSALHGGYRDNDLDINVSGLLLATWNAVKEANDASVYDGFAETLQDIGTTCIQGDSHRLLAYLTALEDDAR